MFCVSFSNSCTLWSTEHEHFYKLGLRKPVQEIIIIIIIIIINILTAIGLAPGGSSPVHIYREHYIEYTNNTQNT